MIDILGCDRHLNKEIAYDEIDEEIAKLEIQFDSALTELNSIRRWKEDFKSNVPTDISAYIPSLHTDFCRGRLQTIYNKLNAYYMLRDGFDLSISYCDRTFCRSPVVEIILDEHYDSVREYEVDLRTKRMEEKATGEIYDIDLDW